ncbi:MAG: nucleotidyltransferase domain-containing protein [Thermostichus sp. BF3_bins_97]
MNEQPDPQAFAQTFPNVKLVVLFGSQARGCATTQSDWDLAYQFWQPVSAWEELDLSLKLAMYLGIPTDDLDAVNLWGCSPLLAQIIASEGKLIYEAEPGLFAWFRVKSWKQYLDTAKFRQLQGESIRRGLERLRHQGPGSLSMPTRERPSHE